MINVSKKEECCGCHACSNICPKNCISMEDDNEGFWYPKVDKNICIDCKLCEKTCPIMQDSKYKADKIIAYACKSRDKNHVKESSSGGIFSVLSEYVIRNNGVVFGATFDDDFNVKHTYVETLEEYHKLRGSKYVQSKIGESYKKAKEFLESDRIVLFSGTPCQISGLSNYLKKRYEKLILIDIACHGVPSPLVFRKYINNIELKNNDKIKKINFRDKSNGWKNYNIIIQLNNKFLKERKDKNLYMKGYLSDLYLRPSCYSCKFKKPITYSDLTLADYWGVEKLHEKFNKDDGTSLVLVNTSKGESIFNLILNQIEYTKTDFEYATKNNYSIISPVKYNSAREVFFEELNQSNVNKLIKKHTNISILIRLKNKLWNIFINK